MKKQIVILILFFTFLAPCFGAKEEMVFESVLKDAIFIPLNTEGGDIIQHDGWWTLKFENGAVISIYCISQGWTIRISKEKAAAISKEEIWWIGKTYIVSKKGFGENDFFVKLKQEEEIK